MNELQFETDKANRKITVKREFNAPLSRVWAAWTESALLDQWWAPKPWKANTKFMNFKEGGHWLYAMNGPDGSEHWSRADFKSIDPQKYFIQQDAFCDSEGNVNPEMPSSRWKVQFSKNGNSTDVDIEITLNSLEGLETLLRMGFKEGFAMGLRNLDELLAAEVQPS
jgi:uncharacterized protein YndB with AHSA1/START domain